MSLTHALRTLTAEEQDYVRARRTRYASLEVPPHHHLVLGVLGSFLAAGAVYALTCGRELWLAIFVFVVGTAAMVVRHVQKRRAAAASRTRWDPPADREWEVSEWHLRASSVAEVGDADGAGDDWLLFRVSTQDAFIVALLDLNFEAAGPSPSIEAIAMEHLVLRTLGPDGPMLPALPSGASLPVHSFRVEGRTWSPSERSRDASYPIPLDRLPDWLRAVLV